MYAIITGAANGLGYYTAIEIAKRGIPTILVDLPNQGLLGFSNEIKSKYNVDSVYYEADLTVKDELIAMAEDINQNYPVSILINNAGLGGSSVYSEASVDYIDNIIQVNVKATAVMCHQILPNLLKQPKAYILNVASMAAFSPMGFKTVYPATKTFVYNFTKSLNAELADTNVSVAVSVPGPMSTNPDNAKRTEKQGFFGKIGAMGPEDVAKVSVDRMLKDYRVIFPNRFNVLNRWFMQNIPSRIFIPAITRVVKREIFFK